jgi:hypothetical protein
MAEAQDTVHVFVSTGRFRSFEEMRAYIDETFTKDGDCIQSAFMREVGLSEYKPDCIEAVASDSGGAVALSELLAGASYSDQWLPLLDGSRLADAAICVFAPNRVGQPARGSMEYIGAFGYRVVHSERFQRLRRGEAPDAERGSAPDPDTSTGLS